LLAKKDLSI